MKRAAVILSKRKVYLVKVKEISTTPYNPSARTEDGAKLNKLAVDIAENGLCYPILVTKELEVVDGNRRLTAVRMLGHEEIECIMCDRNKNRVFSSVNSLAMPIGGAGWVEIAAKGGELPKSKQRIYDEIKVLVGAAGIQEMIDKKIGLNVLSLCKRVNAYDKRFDLASVLSKCIRFGLTNKINMVIRSEYEKSAKVENLVKIFDAYK